MRLPAIALLATIAFGAASPPSMAQHAGHGAPAAADGRQAVDLPAPMRAHMLANMRDHLLALQEIQQALAEAAYERAADIAEKRIGMSSLQLHGADHMASAMPESMRSIGTQMHRSASRFAVEAANAGATGNVKPALGALSKTMQQCVACHAAFRLK